MTLFHWFSLCSRWLFNAAGMLIVVFSVCSCSSGPKRAHERLLSWPQMSYAKVIGYSFQGPDLTSLLTKEGVNVEMLGRLTVAKAGLSQSQTDRLLEAVRTPKESFPEMLCYEPHHVFVFYSEKNEPVAAIEICFTCNRIRTWPDAEMVRLNFGLMCDLPTLARLASELGLGLGAPEMTLPKYLRKLKQQQAENTRFLEELAESRS